MTEQDPRPSRLWRVIAVTLMGLTVLFTLMGGAGTTCVALGAEKYDSMVGLVPYKPLYQLLVVLSLAAGVWGVPVTIKLVRGSATAYRNALLMLLAGAATAGVQVAISQSVRGSSAPANVRLMLTVLTLVVLLLLRLPPLWRKVDFGRPLKGGSRSAAGGTALVVCGLVAASVYLWTGSTHLRAWIDVLRLPILAGGWGMVAAGAGLLAHAVVGSARLDQVATPVDA